MTTSARTICTFIWAGLAGGFGCGAQAGGQSGTDAVELIGDGKPCEGDGLTGGVGDTVRSECLVCTCEESGTWNCYEVCPTAPSPEPLGPQLPTSDSVPEANTPTAEPSPQPTLQSDFPTSQGAMPGGATEVCYTSEGEAMAVGEVMALDECTSCTCIEPATFFCETEANCGNAPAFDTPPTPIDPSLPGPQPIQSNAVCFGPDGGLVPQYSVVQLDPCVECLCVAAGTFACSMTPNCDEQ